MDIGESQLGGVVILHPVGRIDGATSPEFQAKLLQAVASAADGVVIDFADVDYISSAGLRALMTATRQRKDRRLAAAALRPVLQEIFNIARFQHVVPIFGSTQEVAATWGMSAPPADGATASQGKGGPA